MSSKNEPAKAKTRDDAGRNNPAAPQQPGIAGDARSNKQAREQGTQKTQAGNTARKRRPPFVL